MFFLHLLIRSCDFSSLACQYDGLQSLIFQWQRDFLKVILAAMRRDGGGDGSEETRVELGRSI